MSERSSPPPALQLDPDRVARTTEGLRPWRSQGFRVDVQRVGETTVVHNYGHGGGGVTLSWGTAAQAAERLNDLEASPERTPVTVLGAGAVGLATARTLQERGHQVTILTSEMPLDTTSAVAGASWYPLGVFAGAPPSEGRARVFEDAARRAHARYLSLVDAGWGVRWVDEYVPDDSRARLELGMGWTHRMLHDLFPGQVILGPGEHPFQAPYALRYRALAIETPIYLAKLMDQLLSDGATLEQRRIEHVDQLTGLPDRLLFNCTGAGARALFGDATLIPVRGELTHLRPQEGVDYGVHVDELRYVVPRSTGPVLGATWQPERADTTREVEDVLGDIRRTLRTGVRRREVTR